MIERGMDRAEEGAALAPPLGVRQGIGDAVEAFILPAVIARHPLHIAEIDHRSAPEIGGQTREEGRQKSDVPSLSVLCHLSSIVRQAGSAALAFSTIAWNAAGSRMARSESTLRSTRSPALPSPSMNRL